MTAPNRPLFCPNDGTSLTVSARFCGECGWEVPGIAVGSVDPIASAEPMTAPTPVDLPLARRRPSTLLSWWLTSPPAPATRPVPARVRAAAVVFDLGYYAVLSVAALSYVAWRDQTTVSDHSGLVIALAALAVIGGVALVGNLVSSGLTPSPGQALCRIAVVRRADGVLVGPGRAAARGLLLAVLQVTLGVATWSVLWHPGKRGWHDRLTATTVSRHEGARRGVWISVACTMIASVATAAVFALTVS